MSRERSAEEVAGAARRMIRALGRRVGDADPIDLQLVLALRAEVDRAFLTALQGQAEAGFSHAEIAEGLGTSRQAVTKRLSIVDRDSGHGVA